MKRTVCGVGINDADYPVTWHEKQKRCKCPYYRVWENMLYRCYGKNSKSCYNSITVCTEWLTFSMFKAWMENQDWRGNVLDKDLFNGKEYSPESCVFLPSEINEFIAESSNNTLLNGVHYDKARSKFKTEPRNPLTGKRIFKRFDSEIEAHNFWKRVKKDIAEELVEVYNLPNIIGNKLIERYV